MNLAPNIKRLSQWGLVCLFGLVLVLPAIGLAGHWQKTSVIDENRSLAAFPKWRDDPRVWEAYERQIETYFNDHFGFRDWLIAAELGLKRVCLPAELGPKIVRGRDGWLYLRHDDTFDLVDDRLGLIKLPQPLMEQWRKKIEGRRDQLAARGIKYLFVIAPNKESVYPEYLPDWLTLGRATEADQLLKYLRLHSTAPILDLRPVLRAARQPVPLYYKTDDHWNLVGAFLAAETIITNLSSQIPGLTPLSAADFDIQRMPEPGGDLARLAGSPDWRDDNHYAFTPKPYLPGVEFMSPETNQIDWIRAGSLPVAPNFHITTIDRQRPLKVNLYGDSFSVALQSFLALHFGEVVLTRYAFDQLPGPGNPPDLVLDVMVERHFP